MTFWKASPPLSLYFPAPCFLAITDSILVGCRLSACTTSCITLAQPSKVVPPEDMSLTFPEATPSSPKAEAVDDKAHDLTSEDEFLVRGKVNYNCCFPILPLRPCHLLFFRNSPSSLHYSEASFIHSVPSYVLAQAGKHRVISDYSPLTFPSTPTAHLHCIATSRPGKCPSSFSIHPFFSQSGSYF